MEAIFVFVLFLSSFVVFREPAPFDLLAVVWMVLLVRFRRPAASDRVLFIAALSLWGFLLCNLVSLFGAESLPGAFRYLLISLYLFAVWWTFARWGLVSVRLRAVAVEGWVLAGMLSTMVSMAAYLGFLPMKPPFILYGRACGLFKDPNVFGPFLVPPLLFLLARGVDGERRWRTIAPQAFVLVLGLLMSFSRSTWGNAALSLGIAAVWIVDWRAVVRSTGIFLAVALILAMTIGAAVRLDGIANLLEARLSLQGYDSERFAAWREAGEVAEERLLGVGPGQLPIEIGMEPHNVFLKVLAENGSLGLAALLLFLAVCLFRAVQNMRHGLGGRGERIMAFAALVGVVANGGFVDTLHWRHLWIVAAWPFAIAGGSLLARERRDGPAEGVGGGPARGEAEE